MVLERPDQKDVNAADNVDSNHSFCNIAILTLRKVHGIILAVIMPALVARLCGNTVREAVICRFIVGWRSQCRSFDDI